MSTQQTRVCQVHNVVMTEREKKQKPGEFYFAHAHGSGLCFGRAAAAPVVSPQQTTAQPAVQSPVKQEQKPIFPNEASHVFGGFANWGDLVRLAKDMTDDELPAKAATIEARNRRFLECFEMICAAIRKQASQP